MVVVARSIAVVLGLEVVALGLTVAARALHFEGEHIQYSGLTHAPRRFVGSFDMPNGQQGGSDPLSVMTRCFVEIVEVPHLSSISYIHSQIAPDRSNFTMVLSLLISPLNIDIVLEKDWAALLASAPVTLKPVVTLLLLPPKRPPPIDSEVDIAFSTLLLHCFELVRVSLLP